MGDARGFLEHDREVPERRPVSVRLRDWNEVYEDFSKERLEVQASRCMAVSYTHLTLPTNREV